VVFVTTDHGRGNDFRFHGGDVPESGRVWLLALGNRITRGAFAPAWRVLHLADIAPTVRALADLAPREGAGEPIASLVALGSPRRGF
jgi:hypothetical protein